MDNIHTLVIRFPTEEAAHQQSYSSGGKLPENVELVGFAFENLLASEMVRSEALSDIVCRLSDLRLDLSIDKRDQMDELIQDVERLI